MALVSGMALSLLTALVVIFGDYIIKLAADAGHGTTSLLVIGGCLLYAVSALLWFAALHHVTLSQAGVAFSMFSLLALCAIGVLAFGERLHLRDMAGIGCALMAMVLMVRVG